VPNQPQISAAQVAGTNVVPFPGSKKAKKHSKSKSSSRKTSKKSSK
jgi:hypothetical protein